MSRRFALQVARGLTRGRMLNATALEQGVESSFLRICASDRTKQSDTFVPASEISCRGFARQRRVLQKGLGQQQSLEDESSGATASLFEDTPAESAREDDSAARSGGEATESSEEEGSTTEEEIVALISERFSEGFLPDVTFEQEDQEHLDQGASGEDLWPETVRQKRFASRVRSALEQALLADRVSTKLIQGLGFTIEEVRVEPDLQKAYVLWDAFPESAAVARTELNRRASAIRRSVAKYLKARRVPVLVFCENAPTEEQLELDEAFSRLEYEADSK